MNAEQLLKELEQIFRDNFDDDSIVLTRQTTSEDIEDWDSLEQINLLTAIGKKYGLRFQIRDISGLETVGDMVDLILRMLPEK